ncbi:MAG TPA: hypothetical protein VKX45_09095 [Bryobacteraceae bacterium]|nr:hypothetical protein [Bryobacteraceae bacterium]
MSFSRRWAGAIAGTVLLLAGCARRPEPGVQRLAILRFENLGPDPSTDWMGRAFAEAIASELAGAPQIYAIPGARLHTLQRELGARPISAPGISAEAPLAAAAGASRIAYGQYSVERGAIRARMVIEDPQSRRVVQILQPVSAKDPDVAAAATLLARQIWPQAPLYSAHNPAALRAYTEAEEAGDAEAAERATQRAIADDPDFGAPYLMLAEIEGQRNDRAGMTATLQAAAARGTALAQVDRARLENLAAGLSGDLAARERALATLAKLTPSDPGAWRGLAEIAQNRHEYPQAVQAFERALAIEPADSTSWNTLAYAAAQSGNLTVAMSALRRYQALQPTNPNALDSMGDVNLICGRLQEAEQFYLQSLKMAPGFYGGVDAFKAAMARLMSGDVAGADAIWRQYPAAATHQAEWLWLSGRRRQGYEALAGQAPKFASRDAQAVAYAELAIWSAMEGDHGAAAAMAQKAGEAAGTASSGIAALARFFAAPQRLSAAEWTARAQQFFPGATGMAATGRDAALGAALLIDGEFAPAAEVLRRAYEGSGAAPDGAIAAEFGAALAECGRAQEAAGLLRNNPVPPTAGPGPILALYWPRIFHARALAAEKLGKAEEARVNAKLFETLAGGAKQ